MELLLCRSGNYDAFHIRVLQFYLLQFEENPVTFGMILLNRRIFLQNSGNSGNFFTNQSTHRFQVIEPPCLIKAAFNSAFTLHGDETGIGTGNGTMRNGTEMLYRNVHTGLSGKGTRANCFQWCWSGSLYLSRSTSSAVWISHKTAACDYQTSIDSKSQILISVDWVFIFFTWEKKYITQEDHISNESGKRAGHKVDLSHADSTMCKGNTWRSI